MLRLVATFVFVTSLASLNASSIYYADDVGGGYYADGANYEDHGYMSDFNKDWALLSGRFYQPKCVDIPSNLSLCRNIGYSQMRLPNLLDHDTIAEVTQQAKSWVPLLGIRCHPDTKLFLCSLFSPVCLERMIWPCRSLCEDVKGSCEGFMNKYGFPWPEMLRCDKFPLDNDLCIGLQNHNKPDDTVCEPCNKPETFEGILDNFCSAEFVIRVKIEENVLSEGAIKLTPQRKKRTYKKGSLTKKDLKSLTFYIENGEHCECSKLENTNKKFLVMGRKEGDKLKLTYVMEYDRNNNKDLKRALRAFRKNENICQDINVLTNDGKDGRRKKKPSGQTTGQPNGQVAQIEGRTSQPEGLANSQGQVEGQVTNQGNTTDIGRTDEIRQPPNVAGNTNERKEQRRRKKKDRKNRGGADGDNGNENADRNRKERRKERKRNKKRENADNTMTREERRRRRQEREERKGNRQLQRLRRLRDRRTLDIVDVA